MAWSALPYPPIDDYALVGDLRSAALISRRGSVDWLCLPRFDSSWVFGRLVDWRRGGYFELTPLGEAAATRHYRVDSNVLETTWRQGRSQLRVIDFMPLALRRPRPPRSLRLVRLLQPVQGTIDCRVVFHATFDYGRRTATLKQHPRLLSAIGATGTLVLQYPPGFRAEVRDGSVVLTGSAVPGMPSAFLLHFVEEGEIPAIQPYHQALTWAETTDAYWRSWLGNCRYRGRFVEQVRRSSLALKLMQYEPSGAFIAAPTTSLPERIGGSLNWDYRFVWLRDMAVLVNALHQFGFYREAQQFMDWLEGLAATRPGDLQLIYQVDGSEDVSEHLLGHLDGYGGSRPVRIGNAAYRQVQLDIYGEILEAAHSSWRHTGRLGPATRKQLLAVLDYVIAHWEDDDSGIWESRDRKRRYL